MKNMSQLGFRKRQHGESQFPTMLLHRVMEKPDILKQFQRTKTCVIVIHATPTGQMVLHTQQARIAVLFF
jgi:hypothetical protein